MIALVTGGARSGKSRFAERYVAELDDSAIYIATAEARDEEMRERTRRHRERRDRSGYAWETVEEPLELAQALRAAGGRTVLVDCLTLWLSNRLLRLEQEEQAERMLQELTVALAAAVAARAGHTVLVTNEVGDGVVPEYPLGRLFRDAAGWMNQRLAAVSDRVFLVTAGIPVELKQIAYRPEERP